MVYQLANRLTYIGKRMRGVFSFSSTYKRKIGGNWLATLRPIQLTPGHTDLQAIIADAPINTILYEDFICDAESLVFPSPIGLALPEEGDVITFRGQEFRAVAPTEGEDVFNYTTMLKDRLRIHTLLRKA